MKLNFSDPQIRYLIDYANLKQGVIKYQSDFLSKLNFDVFLKKPYYGFPLVLPLGIKYFKYDNNFTFTIKKKSMQQIFNIDKENYIGKKIFFNFGNKFSYNVKLKKKYISQFKIITKINLNIKKKVEKLKKKYYLSSFQTRNVPHYGHEEIIKRLIQKNGKVFINPLIGMKKKGDFKNDILKKIFNNLIKNSEFKNKVLFAPFIANMHYAGPREAFHHLNIREMIGFDRFTIGRDHAGAENVYKPLDAFKYVSKYSNKLKIDLFLHRGSYFCKTCNKIILKGDCKHNNLQEISGSEFRKSILSKKLFPFARRSTQKYIYSLKGKLFY
tara:strand:+ start:294 stop:1274 length:981 start_codon:yes stop_codon:yes gene_type:complete